MTAVRKSHSDAALYDLFRADQLAFEGDAEHRIKHDAAPHWGDAASKAAAERVAPKLRGLRLLCLRELYLSGSVGSTAMTIADKHGQLLYSIAPRLTELVKMGLATKAEEQMTTNERGNLITVFRATHEGMEIARKAIIEGR